MNADPLSLDADGTDGILGTSDDDLHLRASSRRVDTGTDIGGPDHDPDGNPRPSGS